MPDILVILALLLLALVVAVPLVQRFSRPGDGESLPRLARWILPLAMLLVVLQLLRLWLGS